MVRQQSSTADRGQAIAWLQDGATQQNVAHRLHISQSVIGRLWIRFMDTANITNRPNSGRPRSTTQREDRYLTNWKLHQRWVTARQINTGTLISNQTVRNQLQANNLIGNRYLQEVIQPFVIPALQRIGAVAMFLDENARPHHARVVTDFLRQHNVNRMDWPPYLPDLNPIEHARDIDFEVTMPHHPIMYICLVCFWQSGRQYHRLSFKDW